MTTYYPTKLGFYTLRKLAGAMCKALQRFTPIIKLYFPDSVALHTLLDTLAPLCSQLVSEIDAARAEAFPP